MRRAERAREALVTAHAVPRSQKVWRPWLHRHRDCGGAGPAARRRMLRRPPEGPMTEGQHCAQPAASAWK
eukprot:15430824-Alexandrium_andersonii.AAC.1